MFESSSMLRLAEILAIGLPISGAPSQPAQSEMESGNAGIAIGEEQSDIPSPTRLLPNCPTQIWTIRQAR
jgi:hypothetical protein